MKKLAILFLALFVTACASTGDIDNLQAQIDTQAAKLSALQDVDGTQNAAIDGLGNKVNSMDHEFNEKLNLLFQKTMQK